MNRTDFVFDLSFSAFVVSYLMPVMAMPSLCTHLVTGQLSGGQSTEVGAYGISHVLCCRRSHNHRDDTMCSSRCAIWITRRLFQLRSPCQICKDGRTRCLLYFLQSDTTSNFRSPARCHIAKIFSIELLDYGLT